MDSPAAEEFEEFRINHGQGLTPSEQILKYFGERSFLRFWSHANPHLTPKQELCDLLVVCGDFVVVFSDKSVKFQSHKEEALAWRRWYRDAIEKSVRQLNGAVRHLLGLREATFKDRFCRVPLGVPLPPRERAKVYRVAIVSKTKMTDAVEPPETFLTIDGGIIGDHHITEESTPFSVGDVSPDTEFVHVIDLAGLWAILSELDTIADFARYLDAREAFVRATGRNCAANEWCILTRYLFSFNANGDPLPLDSANPGFARLGNGERLAKSTKEDLKKRRDANRDSYLWDFLIDRQAEMIEQQNFEFATYNSVQEGERVVRHMALETRLNRRLLGKSWKEACLIAAPEQVANIRTVPHSDQDATTYVFFTLAHPSEVSYEEYRHRRREWLQEFVIASLVDVPTSRVIIGIASELGQEPDSYDLLHFNVAEDANQETLQADAKASWDFKRRIFEGPIRTEYDERDIPPVG